MAAQAQQRTATVRGAVFTYQGEAVDERLGIRWLTGPDREVVRELRTDARGGYTVEGLNADQLYWVEIEGSVGLPSGVIPEEGLNYRCFLMPPSRDTTAYVSGKVLAHDGSDLGGIQQMRWVRASDKYVVVPEFPTTDQGSYQTYEVLVPLGVTYNVYVNRGPAIPFEYGPDGVYCTQDFRRNSGTARTTTSVWAAGDRMRWDDMAGDPVSYPFRVPSADTDHLVSLPGSTRYKVMVKPKDGVWQPSPDSPWTLPDRTGTGSDPQVFTKP
jgi:hypothetical protein